VALLFYYEEKDDENDFELLALRINDTLFAVSFAKYR
jgi:hypothetical protein